MIRRPPRSTQSRSSAASDVYKRQGRAGDPSALLEPARARAATRPASDGDVVAGDRGADGTPALDDQPRAGPQHDVRTRLHAARCAPVLGGATLASEVVEARREPGATHLRRVPPGQEVV